MSDKNYDGAISIKSNINTNPLPGYIRYSAVDDEFQGFTSNINPYNNSHWATMSLSVASESKLGGIKVGNNLGITSNGILNASANGVSRKFQKVLIVSQNANTGDYTSIHQCLDQFFGYDFTAGSISMGWSNSTGELAGLDRNEYPFPGSNAITGGTSRYIVLASPGTYTESNIGLKLPPYISLVGDGREETVLRINPASATPANNFMIGLNEGSEVRSLTIDLATSNVDGVVNNVTGLSPITNATLEDILFTSVNNTDAQQTAINLVAAGGVMCRDLIGEINLTAPAGGASNFTAINLNTCNDITLNNCGFSINVAGSANTVVGLSAVSSNVAGTNCQFLIEQTETAANNTVDIRAVSALDSDIDLEYSKLSALGFDGLDANDDDVVQKSRAVSLSFGGTPINVLFPSVSEPITFVHYDDKSQFDEIMAPLSFIDFKTYGITRGSYIYMQSPVANPQNMGYFKVANVITDTVGGTPMSIIQIDLNYNLEDDTVTSSFIRFIILNKLFLYACSLISTNETIFYDSTFSPYTSYVIETARCYTSGESMSVGNSLLILTQPQRLTVGSRDCDFLSLADACDSILDASQYKPYEIVICPGIYYETRTINVPSYVTVTGSSQASSAGDCTIYFEASATSAYTDNTAMKLGTVKSTLSGLKIQVTEGLNTGVVTELIGISCIDSASLSGTSTNIVNCTLEITYTVGTGVALTDCVPLKVEIIDNVQIDNFAINITTDNTVSNVFTSQFIGSTCLARDFTINASASGSANVYGMYINRSVMKVANPQISVSGASIDVIGYYLYDQSQPNPVPSPAISVFTNTLYGGQIMAYSSTGTNIKAVSVQNNSILVAYNTAFLGPVKSLNVAGNAAANSIMRSLNSYYLTRDPLNGTITASGQLDNNGHESAGGVQHNLTLGDAGPAPGSSFAGVNNLVVGDANTAALYTSGSQSTILGIHAANQMASGSNAVIIGYQSGNSVLDGDSVLIGSEAAKQVASSELSVVIGRSAARDLQVTQHSVLLGANIMVEGLAANNTIAVGYGTAGVIQSAESGIFMGTESATSMQTSTRDIIIGSNTLTSMLTGSDCVIVGTDAVNQLTDAVTSVFIGNQVAQKRTQVDESVFIGYQAGFGESDGLNNTGGHDIIIGSRAASGLTSGSDSVVIGTGAAPKMTTGSRNIIMGNEQMSGPAATAPAANLTSGSDDIIIGTASGSNLTTGSRVMVIGNESGRALTNTNDVIILGYGSGNQLTGVRDKSIIIGNESGLVYNGNGAIIIGHGSATNATGDDICIIGNQAGRSVRGPRNTFIGNYTAGVSEAVYVLGSDNLLIGPNAGYQLTTGSYNVVFGSGVAGAAAGDSLETGNGNMLIGYQAGKSIIGGSFNVCLGYRAGYNLRNSDRNVIIGNDAAPNLADDNFNNLILGNEAGYNFFEGSNVVMIGNRAGYNSNTNLECLYIGNYAGYSNESGSQNSYLGNFSGQYATGSQNTGIGERSLQRAGDGANNIGIGNNAGRGALAGVNHPDRVIAIGNNAGRDISAGYDDILIGTEAGRALGSGARSIMIGPYAGSECVNTSNSVFIGVSTSNGVGVGRVTSGQYNLFVGINVGIYNTTGDNNVFMGNQSGLQNTTGANNIAMGQNAGRDLTTGSGHILIGTKVGALDTAPGLGLSTGNNDIIIGYNAGSNCTPAISDVIIMGTNAGFNNGVDRSIFIGSQAGRDNSTGAGCIYIGPNAAKQSTVSGRNIAVGSNAAAAYIDTGVNGQNIFMGDETAAGLTNGVQNIGLGANALCAAGNVNSTIAIGFEAGKVIGNRAVPAGGDANRNIIMGYQSASGGDINSDNILVGTQVAQHVDSALGFADNLFMGTRTGHNANLAVNSIAIGNANRVGTGGVSNLMMGTGAGDNVGNPMTYYAITISDIQQGDLTVNVNMPYTQAYAYFKDGDHIAIQSGIADYNTVIASILPITGDQSNITVVFDNAYSGTTITAGAKFSSLSVLETDIGTLDFSKASGNSLLGESAGSQLTSGAKNNAIGTQAMKTNKIGKYNNIVGTQAGYNVISDNNTLFGTRAGYSLDTSANNAALVSANLVFASNGNAIYSNTLSNLGNFEFGTVIDISNSTDNDGRYTVELGVNQPTDPNATSYMILEGQPVYEELGVPGTVPPNAIRINSARFSIIRDTRDGQDLYAGWFTSNDISYNGLYTNGGILPVFDDTIRDFVSVVQISGSKYNDGLHYIDMETTALLGIGYVATIDKLVNEQFDSGVTISIRCITADNITGSNDFKDFNYSNPINMFFTINKGLYTASPLTKKHQISIPDNRGMHILDKAVINDDIEKDNIVFGSGYKSIIQPSASETSANYQVFDKLEINALLSGCTILFINNTIVISKIADYGLVVGEFYEIEAYSSGGGALICGSQVILIDAARESGINLIYDINSEYPLPATLVSVSRIVFKKCQVKQLVRSVTNEFAAGDIVLFNISHEFGLKTERGAFIVRDAISPAQTDNRLLIRCDDTIPDIYGSLFETQDKLWNSNGSYSPAMQSNTAGISSITQSNIAYRIFQTNNYIDAGLIQDTSNIVSGWGLFSQNLTVNASNVYTCYAGNNCITADRDYEFVDIVAPCYIAIYDPAISYYVVKENKWPFNKLVIDSASGTLNSTTITSIQVRSISSRFDSSNLANVANNFVLLGMSDPDQTFESTPIARYSTEVNSKTLLTDIQTFTVNSYDTVMTIAAYDNTPNSTPGYTCGYFKNANLSANVTVLYNNFYGSLYEPATSVDYTNTFVEGKQLIVNPDISNPDKYVISNAGNASTFWSNISSLPAPSNIFTSASPNLNIITFANPIDVYGESFTQAKISKFGYLLFESNTDVYQLAFNASADTAFNPIGAGSNIRVWDISVPSGVNAPGYTLVHYMVNNDPLSNDQSAANNVQLKIFPDSATFKANRVELCYSNSMSDVTSNSVVIGMDRMGSIVKDCRYETDLSLADNVTCTNPYEGYLAGEFDLNNSVLTFDKSQTTLNNSSILYVNTSSLNRNVLDMYDKWVFTAYSAIAPSNIGVYTNNNGAWSLYEEIAPNGMVFSDIVTVNCFSDKLIIKSPLTSVDAITSAGEFYYYKYDGLTWNNQIQTCNLSGTIYGPTAFEYFGTVVSMSNNLMAVGTAITSDYGRVYLLEYDENSDNFTVISRIISSDYDGFMGDGFGENLVLYGKYLAVYANNSLTYLTYSNQGIVNLFDISNPESPILLRTFISDESGSLIDKYFGRFAIKFYNEGHLLIGDTQNKFGSSFETGRIYIVKSINNWTSIYSIQSIYMTDIGYSGNTNFGFSMDIYANNLIVGTNSTTGFAYLYTYDGINWVNGYKITYNIAPNMPQYTRVAIHSQGYGVLIFNIGVFTSPILYYSGSVQSAINYNHYEATLTSPNPAFVFNKSISIYGDYMAINSYNIAGGRIFMYKLNNNTWEYTGTAININAYTIVLYEDYMVVQAAGYTYALLYIYKRDTNGNWNFQNMITSVNLYGVAEKEIPISINGSNIFIGQIEDGLVKVYDIVTIANVADITQALFPPPYAADIATNDNYVVIGYNGILPFDPAPDGFINVLSHSDYSTILYTLQGTSTTLISPGYFGASVAINNQNNILVGAWGTNFNKGGFTLITSVSSAFDTVTSVNAESSQSKFGYKVAINNDNVALITSDTFVYSYNIDNLSKPFKYNVPNNNGINLLIVNNYYISLITQLGVNVYVYKLQNSIANILYVSSEVDNLQYINNYSTFLSNNTPELAIGSNTISNLYPSATSTFTLNGIQYDLANVSVFKNGSIGFSNNDNNYQYINIFGGYEFDRVFSNIDINSNVLTIVYDKRLDGNTFSTAYTSLYLDGSLYAKNIAVGYKDMPSNANGTISISSLRYNQYNGDLNITQPATVFSINYTLPNPVLAANIDLLEPADILRVEGNYYEVLDTANSGGNYYVAINITDGTDSSLAIGDYNIECNEFRATPTVTPQGDTVNYNFRNARTLVGKNSDFLRFSQVRSLDYSPYNTNQRDIHVTDATYNFATCTLDTSNSVSLISNNVVYLRETVPNEYGNMLTSNIASSPDKYIVSIGTPTLDPGSNVTLQTQNINSKPTGFIDVLVNNTGTGGDSSINWILNSIVDALVGNVTINTLTNTITIADIGPDMTYGGSIHFRNDGIGLINKVTNTFDNILPGTYIRIWDSSHDDTYLITGKANPLTLTYDATFSAGTNETISFNGGAIFRIDYGFTPDSAVANGVYPLISGQVISDRIDFNQFNNIAPYNPANTAPVVNYLAVHKLSVFNLEGLNNSDSYPNEYFYYFNNYKIYDGSFKRLPNAYTANISNSTLDFHYSGGVNNRTLMYDIGDHTLLLPASNIASHISTNIEFINFSESHEVEFVSISGNKAIYESTDMFADVLPGQLIKVSGAGTFNGYYLVSSSVPSTSSYIYIDPLYRDFTPAPGDQYTAIIESNVIYSNNTADIDLSVYKPGQKLKIEATLNNNTQVGDIYEHNAYVIANNTETCPTCLYITMPAAVITESGYYCKISKCILTDELTSIELSNVSTDLLAGDMNITPQSNSFVLFRDGQILNVNDTISQLATIAVAGYPQLLSMNINIVENTGLTSGDLPTIIYEKPITFKKIGTPISTITADGVVKFHYLDAQGNNLMLGSFTGQFAGASSLSIQNVFIGNKVGQTNQGSGNILLGNETGFALTADDGATSYNNKFAVYKNNFIGVPSNPLLGGDFASGRVGVNTIDPDSLLTGALDTVTRMVVNGRVRAQAFNTFTGTHFVTITETPGVRLEPGMLMVSTGKVNKQGLLDTIVDCRVSSQANDKRVYGVYSNCELVNGNEVHQVASLGEGQILICNIGGDLENGDYISSSPIPGLGQRQADDIVRSYTVAKVTEDVDWASVHEYVWFEGVSYKRALVACTYHCG